MNDVYVGIPHAGVVKFGFAHSLAMTFSRDRERRKEIGGIVSSQSPYLTMNANHLVARFLAKEDAKYLWCVEWDHAISEDVLYALLDADKPIIGAMYFVDIGDGLIVPSASQSTEAFDPLRNFRDEGIMEVGSVGMGCTLIKREVLEQMYLTPHPQVVKPWYWYDNDQVMHGDKHMRLGHDVAFCRRAAHLGFKSYWHCGAQVPHLDKGRTLDLKAFVAQTAKATVEVGK